MWTGSQRGVLLGVLVGLLIYFSIRWYLHPTYVSDPPLIEAARAGDLADRIDPNTADAATLAALPMIGPKRADDIIAHRARSLAEHPNESVFSKPEDLMNVPGIGPATVESLREHFLFPTTRPSEQ